MHAPFSFCSIVENVIICLKLGTRYRKLISTNIRLNNHKTKHTMSNGSNIDVSGAINSVVDAAGKISQLQIDFLNNSLNVLSNAAGPVAKTATDLITSFANTATQVLQSVSSAIAPKK
jgi:chlorosome envelope protein B